MIKFSKYMMYLLPVTMFLWGCDKIITEQEQTTLSGKAFYINPLIPFNDTLPLKGQKIEAKDSATGIIYELITDSLGRFLMPGWTKDKLFRLGVNFTLNDSAQYKVSFTGSAQAQGETINNVQLIAKADTMKYKTMLLAVKDVFGGKIRGASVFIYSSRVIATADTAFKGLGTLVNLKTGPAGACLAMELPNDSIFIKSFYKLDTVINLRSSILGIKLIRNYTDTSIVIQ